MIKIISFVPPTLLPPMKKFYKIFGSVLICLSAFLGTIKDSTVFAAGTQVSIRSVEIDSNSDNVFVISVEFADYTSGTLVLTINGTLNRNILPIGARLSNIYDTSGSTGSGRYTFQVDDCKQFLIYCYPNSTSGTTYSPYATVYSNDTSYVEHVNQSFIESMFETSNGYIDDLESAVSSINTILTSISENVTDIESLIGGSNTRLDAIIAELGVLVYQGSDDDAPSLYDILTGVLDILTNLYDNNIDYSTVLNSILSATESLLDGSSSPYGVPLESLPAYLMFNGVDASYDSAIHYSVLDIPSGYSTTSTQYNYGSTYKLYFFSSAMLNSSSISVSNADLSFTLSASSADRLASVYRLYCLTLTPTTTLGSSIVFNTATSIIPVYFGDGNNMSQEMQSLLDLQSENLTSERLLELIEAVQDIPDYSTLLAGIQSAIAALDLNVSIGSLISYTVPLESVPAYLFMGNGASMSVDSLINYPVLTFSSGYSTVNTQFNLGATYKFYYFCANIHSTSNLSVSNSNLSYSVSVVSPQRLFARFRLYCLTLTPSVTLGSTVTFNFGTSIIPVYFGDGKNMSQEMQSLLGITSETLTTERLTEIIGLLGGSVDSDVSTDFDNNNDSFNQNLDNYNNITDDIFDQFDDSTSQLDLTDDSFSISSDVLSAFNFISTNVQSLVTTNSSISILFYLPVLLGIAFIFLGMRRDK